MEESGVSISAGPRLLAETLVRESGEDTSRSVSVLSITIDTDIRPRSTRA